MATTKTPELQAQTHLTRVLEATLKIRAGETRDLNFTNRLLARSIEELPSLPSGLLVRIYEAACGVDWAGEELVAFRHRCQRLLANHLFPKAADAPAPR